MRNVHTEVERKRQKKSQPFAKSQVNSKRQKLQQQQENGEKR